MGSSRKSFTTEDEIEYIKGLGTWSDCQLSHSELIKMYIENNPLRSNWGEIDRDEVMEVARDES